MERNPLEWSKEQWFLLIAFFLAALWLRPLFLAVGSTNVQGVIVAIDYTPSSTDSKIIDYTITASYAGQGPYCGFDGSLAVFVSGKGYPTITSSYFDPARQLINTSTLATWSGSGGTTLTTSSCGGRTWSTTGRLTLPEYNTPYTFSWTGIGNDYGGFFNQQSTLITYTPYKEPPMPTPPPSGGIRQMLTLIWAGIKMVFDKIPFLTISGAAEPIPGSTQTYDVQVTPPASDLKCADGYCEFQYGMWGLIDKDQNVLVEGTPKLLNGTSYYEVVTITIPTSPSSYVLTGVVTQINMTYTNTEWTASEEGVVASESFGLTVRASIPVTPPSTGFGAILMRWITLFKASICSATGFLC